jgi:hypothetical protein
VALCELFDQDDNRVNKSRRILRWRRNPKLFDDLTLGIDQRPGDFRTTDINAYCVHRTPFRRIF